MHVLALDESEGKTHGDGGWWGAVCFCRGLFLSHLFPQRHRSTLRWEDRSCGRFEGKAAKLSPRGGGLPGNKKGPSEGCYRNCKASRLSVTVCL